MFRLLIIFFYFLTISKINALPARNFILSTISSSAEITLGAETQTDYSRSELNKTQKVSSNISDSHDVVGDVPNLPSNLTESTKSRDNLADSCERICDRVGLNKDACPGVPQGQCQGRLEKCECGCEVCLVDQGEICDEWNGIVCDEGLMCMNSQSSDPPSSESNTTDQIDLQICHLKSPTIELLINQNTGSLSVIVGVTPESVKDKDDVPWLTDESLGAVITSSLILLVVFILIMCSVYLVKVAFKHRRKPTTRSTGQESARRHHNGIISLPGRRSHRDMLHQFIMDQLIEQQPLARPMRTRNNSDDNINSAEGAQQRLEWSTREYGPRPPCYQEQGASSWLLPGLEEITEEEEGPPPGYLETIAKSRPPSYTNLTTTSL